MESQRRWLYYIEAQNRPNFKNIKRILLSLSSHICVSFSAVACFAMFIKKNRITDISHFSKSIVFIQEQVMFPETKPDLVK